jgi:hypothetical protein
VFFPYSVLFYCSSLLRRDTGPLLFPSDMGLPRYSSTIAHSLIYFTLLGYNSVFKKNALLALVLSIIDMNFVCRSLLK